MNPMECMSTNVPWVDDAWHPSLCLPVLSNRCYLPSIPTTWCGRNLLNLDSWFQKTLDKLHRLNALHVVDGNSTLSSVMSLNLLNTPISILALVYTINLYLQSVLMAALRNLDGKYNSELPWLILHVVLLRYTWRWSKMSWLEFHRLHMFNRLNPESPFWRALDS